jgi:hypothetical protein
MDTTFSFEYVFPTGPSIKKPIHYTDSTIVFDGYFRVEDDLPTKFPIRRIFYRYDTHAYHLIQITGIKRGENTSHYFYDESEQGMICLTPTEIIELTYVVLESDLTSEKAHELNADIWLEEKALRAANEELYNERMDRQIAEWKRNRTIE